MNDTCILSIRHTQAGFYYGISLSYSSLLPLSSSLSYISLNISLNLSLLSSLHLSPAPFSTSLSCTSLHLCPARTSLSISLLYLSTSLSCTSQHLSPAHLNTSLNTFLLYLSLHFSPLLSASLSASLSCTTLRIFLFATLSARPPLQHQLNCRTDHG